MTGLVCVCVCFRKERGGGLDSILCSHARCVRVCLCLWKWRAMKWKKYMKVGNLIQWYLTFSIQGAKPHLHSPDFVLYSLLSKPKKETAKAIENNQNKECGWSLREDGSDSWGWHAFSLWHLFAELSGKYREQSGCHRPAGVSCALPDHSLQCVWLELSSNYCKLSVLLSTASVAKQNLHYSTLIIS